MSDSQLAFVAYPSNDGPHAHLVLAAVRHANARSSAVRYEPWEYNDVAGQPVISPILERIDESSFVVADITYLNLNVVYEIGFSIGSGKRVFLIRHAAIPGDREIARQAGIFDTLGYFEYSDSDVLSHRLTSHIDLAAIHFTTTVDFRTPVYVVEPPEKDAAATLMVSRLKKAGYRYRSFNPSEDSRLSATDAVRQVAASAGTLVLMRSRGVWAHVHNVRSFFVAGLADGMSKPTLFLCPIECSAPLDVRDEVKTFREPADIAAHIANFVPNVAEYLQRVDPTPLRLATPLQTLAMGDPTAENEMTTLANYFVPTDQYGRTLQGAVNLVVGRKGSGKTALFIQIRDKVRADVRNIVVDLKPEGYQLVKLKEDILTHLSEGSRQHLITAFWEYLLLLEVAYKLLEKDRNISRYNHEIGALYRELESAYRDERLSSEGDFSERLLSLSQKVSSEYAARYGDGAATRLTTDQVTELVYSSDIRILEDRICKYLEKKHSVWVLFDNLDKGWSTKGVDEIDAVVLRCLIDAGRKLERNMRRKGHTFHCIVFVRNDVYDFVMRHSSDYGKEMRAVVDWTDADQLRELLRLRLVSALNLERDVPFEKIWPQVCTSHYHGEESTAFLIDRSLMRPRNLLKIFEYSRGFANNLSRTTIAEEDIEKGMRVYSQDLLVDLGHELVDVFPAAEDLLYYFMDAKTEMSRSELGGVLDAASVERADHALVLDFLLYYGVIGLRTRAGDQFIFNVNYDPKVLQIRSELEGDAARFVMNPAFLPALGLS
jgi:hypothetical protein